MIRLIPAVKELKEKSGSLLKKAIYFDKDALSARLTLALGELPYDADGTPVSITHGGGEGEGYSLKISEYEITVVAESEAGAFYAIQTLRQLFLMDTVPCLEINDSPDFKYRGLYQDVTRGRVAKLSTLKRLIDMAASYKMNAFQLYVEYVYPFKECEEITRDDSVITPDELRELDAYCRERFIDFQPSLSTFGHMFDILDIPKHRHLRVLKDYENNSCRWVDRHSHHTIDPTMDESIELVKSLIDQYAPCFTSDYFNVCCDETFDLKSSYPEEVEAELYTGFVKKIIAHVKSMGKTPMMWADIILKHPEKIDELPDDVVYLNWNYRREPDEEGFARLGALGKKQIVCPGTSSWWRFCERVETSEGNIKALSEYAYKHGALGVLTTNWGDWGHPASIESSSYGIALGAASSWRSSTLPDGEFHDAADRILYRHAGAFDYLKSISDAHNLLNWQAFVTAAHNHRDGAEVTAPISKASLDAIRTVYAEVYPRLRSECWDYGDFKSELLLSLEAICVCAELGAKLSGLEVERLTDTEAFLGRYSEKWLLKNKASDLWRIEEILRYVESI